MREMTTAPEQASPPSVHPTPPPRDAPALSLRPAHDRPTPEVVLRWVVDAPGPWFPALHAKKTGTPRDAYDGPLAELRAAGMVKVGAWEKGLGQGYVATPEGAHVAGRLPPDAAADEEPLSPALAGILDLRPPLTTPFLIGLNVAWYVLAVAVALRWKFATTAALGGGSAVVLERVGALSATDLVNGQWWRLLTCAFVHIGFWHLALNMIGLGMTGAAAELLWGRWRAGAIYVVSAVAGSCVAMANRPVALDTEAPVILGGASGAVWGLMGAVLAWYVLFRRDLPADLADDLGRRLGFAFLLNAGVSFLPGVSWECHLGGGIAGFVAAGLLNVARFSDPARRAVAAGLFAAIPTGSVAGLVIAMEGGDAWAPVRARRTTPVVAPQDLPALMKAISPDAAGPARLAAAKVWAVSEPRRERLLRDARGELDRLRTAAAEAVRAAGTQPADPGWAKARAAAEARVREVEELRKLVEAAEPPPAGAWAAWGALRREADAHWQDPPP
jgi:rhomboid protease GluP